MSNYAGRALVKLRGQKTQKEMADILGYGNPQFVSLIENGHSKMPIPSVAVLKRKGFDVTPLLKAIIKDFESNLKEQIK